VSNTSRLVFKYIFNNSNYVRLKQTTEDAKQLSLLVSHKKVMPLAVHIKMGSTFFKTQLIDIFAYELPNFKPLDFRLKSKISKPNSSIVYNFHNLLNQTRYYIFAISNTSFLSKKNLNYYSSLSTITELFNTAAWLEREVAELHGVNFLGKKDLRNLMLQYGDTTNPFKKSNPSTGFREIFYDSVSDLIVQNYTTFQG